MNEKGITLIEIMIASLILIAGIAPLIGMFINVLPRTEDTELIEKATLFAEDLMEEILQGPCNNATRFINTNTDEVTPNPGGNARRVLYSPPRAWDEFNGGGPPDNSNRRGDITTYTPHDRLGPEPGEDNDGLNGLDRLTWDDIDDYNGFRDVGPFHDINGREIPDSRPFTRLVRVFYALGDNAAYPRRYNDPTEDRTNFKGIEVRIEWREGGRRRFYTLSTVCSYYP